MLEDGVGHGGGADHRGRGNRRSAAGARDSKHTPSSQRESPTKACIAGSSAPGFPTVVVEMAAAAPISIAARAASRRRCFSRNRSPAGTTAAAASPGWAIGE